MAPCDFILSAPVYFPNYLLDHCPALTSTIVIPAMHLQESRPCSVLFCFTHPWGSCQLNLANSTISFTSGGNPAGLFLALNAMSWEMLQLRFLDKSFEQVEYKEEGRRKQETFLFPMTFVISAFSSRQFSKCYMMCLSPGGLVSLTSHLLLSLLLLSNLFRVSAKQLPGKGVHVSGNW